MDMLSANPSSLCVYQFHHNDALRNPEKDLVFTPPNTTVSEREGFEPSMILSYRRSRSTPSTTRTSFLAKSSWCRHSKSGDKMIFITKSRRLQKKGTLQRLGFFF